MRDINNYDHIDCKDSHLRRFIAEMIHHAFVGFLRKGEKSFNFSKRLPRSTDYGCNGESEDQTLKLD